MACQPGPEAQGDSEVVNSSISRRGLVAGCDSDVVESTSAQLRVGCALHPKKVARYLTPAMVATAKAAGIQLTLIDREQALADQGPFNAIIHKLRPNAEWECELQEYAASHPDVRIIDSVEGIRTLRNRATMLSVLQDPLILPRPEGITEGPRVVRVQAPVQVDVPEEMPPSSAAALVSSSGLTAPLLVKPLWTDGRDGSHGLAVVHDHASLEKLLSGACSPSFTPPVVVQEYVEHGGVLHKVYVLGATNVVCRRPSLDDRYLQGWRHGVLQLPRISCKTVRPDFKQAPRAAEPGGTVGECDSPSLSAYEVTVDCEAELTPGSSSRVVAAAVAGGEGGEGEGVAGTGPPRDAEVHSHAAERRGAPQPQHASSSDGAFCGADNGGSGGTACPRPPEWVTHALAHELRTRLSMQLFNFDLIVPTEDPVSAGNTNDGEDSVYFVVDINYFPGVDKIPNFEGEFVGFLRAACTSPPGP